MRTLHWVQLDKRRPALLLTRPEALRFLSKVTVAPITSTVRGIAIEVPVDREHGLQHPSVVNFDNVTTLPRELLGARIGMLRLDQEQDVLDALRAAYGIVLT